jgi:hypothetical protein
MTGDLNRRNFLRAGAATALAAGLPAAVKAAAPTPTADAVIFLMLTGGPSQLDTFDPKPLAPSDVRGPFAPIPTRVPGVHVSELFPKLAARLDKVSLIRSLHHTAAPVHETGFQLLNAGRLFRDGPEWPSVGAVVSRLLPERSNCPAWWVMPGAEVNTGITVSHGQGTGFLDTTRVEVVRPRLADIPFDIVVEGAASAVRSGARFVTVNMYPTVFDAVSWDSHADRGSLATDLGDYRDTVAPTFDAAFAALLDGLEASGRLDRTLVIATGEFGRTPKLNANGGRDHWPGCWTALVAGGGVKGGRVVGASDATGSAPADRPVTPQELVATIYHALGVPPDATIPGPDGKPVRVTDAAPVRELF